jgi:aminoglycoside phosphotransferase (APT) family kinase protein
MHTNEIGTDVSLVGRLLVAQFPQWADLPIKPVESAGTDNAIYRLGEDMALRLPRVNWAIAGRRLSLALVRLSLAQGRRRDHRVPG